MILTLSDDKKSIVYNRLIVKEETKEEIERLHYLLSYPNFETGYFQHGGIYFHQEKPKDILVTRDNIQVYNSYQWGETGVNGVYPVEYLTTRAKNTLFLIRQLLKLEYDDDFKMRSFFAESSKELHSSGVLVETPFDLTTQLKKLEYIYDNKEIALSLLKDAYFDLYMFVDLLTKVDFDMQERKDPILLEHLYTEAQENTPILNLTKKFAKLKQK